MSLPAAVESIRPSVVQIGVSDQDVVLGTGFFVNERGCVVTAKHVVDAGRRVAGVDDITLTIGLAAPNVDQVGGVQVALRENFTRLFAKVEAEDGMNDLAVLRAIENPFEGELPVLIAVNDVEIRSLRGVAALNPESPLEGVSVASSGYPLANNVMITNAGVLASAWATAPDVHDLGLDLGLGIAIQGPVRRYIADLEVNPGNSGGPVYLEDDGSVIGVCVATQSSRVTREGEAFVVDGAPLVYSSGLTIVIPSEYVVSLLDAHGLTHRRGTTAADGPGGEPNA